MEPYITVSGYGRDEIVEKRSKFIASVYPVSRESEATEIILRLKKEYWDARHNVYAYSLRENNICRYSDDGEPSGTAGVPVLDVIKKRGITDCLIVVTRYFGGVLLGTGGLVRAYTASALKGIEKAGVVRMEPCSKLSVCCEYSDYDALTRLITLSGGNIIDSRYAENIEIDFSLDSSLLDNFSEKLKETFCARIELKITGECYCGKAE